MIGRNRKKEVTSHKGIPVYEPDPGLKKDGYKFEIITDAKYRFKKIESLKAFIDTRQKRYFKTHSNKTDAAKSVQISHWANAVNAVEEIKDVQEIDSFIEGEHRESVLEAAEEQKEKLTGGPVNA